MMDDALLRPGRLEVQIEIGLPKVRGPSFTSMLISQFYQHLYQEWNPMGYVIVQNNFC